MAALSLKSVMLFHMKTTLNIPDEVMRRLH